jgi:hypothetical protein
MWCAEKVLQLGQLFQACDRRHWVDGFEGAVATGLWLLRRLQSVMDVGQLTNIKPPTIDITIFQVLDQGGKGFQTNDRHNAEKSRRQLTNVISSIWSRGVGQQQDALVALIVALDAMFDAVALFAARCPRPSADAVDRFVSMGHTVAPTAAEAAGRRIVLEALVFPGWTRPAAPR